MKIAMIVVTLNDDYKFNQWVKFHNEYQPCIYKHIIVDNGSDSSYVEELKRNFQKSIIIELKTNMGLTTAYNKGIEYALIDNEVDSIFLMANDIKMTKESIETLYDFLFDNNLDMVSPILLEGNSNIINDFGSQITKMMFMKPYMKGRFLSDLDNNQAINLCQALTGGVNLARRSFYETIGYQDEHLFMYSDEVDIGIRARKKGLKMAGIRSSIAWHNHINRSGIRNRNSYTGFLIARNKVYLSRKHFGILYSILVFIYMQFFVSIGLIKLVLKRNQFNFSYLIQFSKGSFYGLFNNMNNKRFIAMNNKEND